MLNLFCNGTLKRVSLDNFPEADKYFERIHELDSLVHFHWMRDPKDMGIYRCNLILWLRPGTAFDNAAFDDLFTLWRREVEVTSQGRGGNWMFTPSYNACLDDQKPYQWANLLNVSIL